MSNSTHGCRNVFNPHSFPLVTIFLFATTPFFLLRWPEHDQIGGAKVFSGVYFRLAQTFVLVHLLVVVAVKTFGQERANGLFGHAPRAPQHVTLREDAHHVPARLLVHDNIIATLHLV